MIRLQSSREKRRQIALDKILSRVRLKRSQRPVQELAHVPAHHDRSGSPPYLSRRTRNSECFQSKSKFKRIYLQKGRRNLRREGAGGLRIPGQGWCSAKLQVAFGRPPPDRRISPRRRHLRTGEWKRTPVYRGGDRKHHGSPDQAAHPREGG